jgi:CysZ protein
VVIREFLAGVGLLARGFGTWRTAPGLMLLGLLPAVVVGILFAAGVIALGLNLENLAVLATPFAEPWDEPLRIGLRVLVGLAFLGVAILLIIYTFTAVTLAAGQPLYERIWRHVEERSGPLPESVTSGFWRTAGRALTDAIRMLVPTILAAVGLLLLGLVPLVGTVLAAVLGALVGGWFLAIELTGPAFEARGLSLRERRRALRSRRALALGFGLASYLLFLVPLGAVLTMPAAVAGATLLSRRVLGEPES